MATLEERLAKMRADLKTMQGRTAGAQTTDPTTDRTNGTGASAPAAGGSGAKSTGGANSLDQRLARMRADLQAMKTASQLLGQTPTSSAPSGGTFPAGGEGLGAEVPGLKLPTLGDVLPEYGKLEQKMFQHVMNSPTPVSVKLSSAQSNYDRVTRELEEAREAQKQADEDMGWAMFKYGTTFDPALAAANSASESAAQRVRDLEKQQSQYANQLYTYRNERDAARLSADTGDIGTMYKTLRDADDELNRLQVALHNWDVSPYTPEQQQAMAQRVNELTAQVSRQKEEFDAAAKAAGYVVTYDGLREYEKNKGERETADEIVRQAGESAKTPGGAWAMSALSVLGKPWETVETVAGMLGSIGHNDPGNLDTYRPLDTGKFTMSRVGEMTRGTVGGNLAKAFPLEIGGQNVAQMLYDTGMSIADSAYLAATLGAAGSAVGGAKAGANLVGGAMFGSAAANQMQSAAERGGTNTQILMSGLAAGTAEVLFESFSIEKLLAEKSVSGWKSWVKETMKQMGVEASEEMATEVANILTDTAIMGDSSDFSQNVAQYQAAGMTKDDAKRQAFLDALKQVAVAGVGGALSGALMGGVNNARMGVQNSRILNDASKGIMPDAETVAALNESEAGREILEQAQQRYEQFQRGQQGAQEGQEGPYTPGAVPAQGEDNTAPLPSQAGSQGQNETAPASGAVDDGIVPFTQQEAENLTSTKGVVNGLGGTFRQFIDNVRNLGNTVRFYFGKVPMSLGQRIANAVGQDVTGYNIAIRSDEVMHTLTQHGDTTREKNRGQIPITPEILERLPEVFNNPDEVVSTEQKDYAGRTSFEVRKQIDGYMVAVAGIANGRHSIEIDSVYVINRKGSPTTTDATQNVSPGPTPETSSRQTLSANSVPQPSGNVNTGRPAPGLRDLRGRNGGLRLAALLGDEDVAFLDRLGKAAGVAINIVDADARARGWYQNGQVYIAENAANEGRNSQVRQVAIHEITHYMKDAAPEEYRRYTRMVAELLGEDLDGAVQRVKSDYAEAGVELSDEDALDEVAAHFTENLMEDESLYRRLAVKDRTLAQRVLDALRRFIERIKGAITGRQTGQLEQIAEAWADALDQTGANTRQGGVETSEGRMYSIRRTADGEQYVDVDVDQARFEGLSVSEMQAEAKKVILERFRNQVIGQNYRAYVNKSAAEHYAYPANRRMDITQKQDKMQAATELDHIMEAATFRENVPDDGRHPNATGGIDKLDVKFRVNGRMYDAEISVLVTDRGRLFYDLTKFRDTTGREIGLTQSAAETPSGVSTQSVTQSGKEVNPQRELTFQEEVQRQLTGTDPRDAEGQRTGKGSESESGRLYSLEKTEGLGKELYELRKQNQRLEEKNKRLQAQFRRTDGNHVDPDAVKSAARKLLRDFNSTADLEETAAAMESIYDHMGETELNHRDKVMQNAARNLAQAIVDSASVTNDEMWQTYRPLRKFLRETKIKVTPDVMGGLDVVGGLGEYRKAFRNRLNLSTQEGRSIDDVYGELSYDYPELFNQDVHSNEEEQLVHLGEVLDALRPTTANPYTGDEGVVDYLAGEILERYYDMPGEAPTFADRAAYRQQEAVERERQAGLERMQRALARQEERTRDRIERVKEQNRQANARMRERMTTTQVKDTVKRHAEGLSRKLLRPTDKQNIPERLRGTVVALLDSIDLESKYAYETTPEGQFRRVSLVDESGKPIQRDDLKPTKRTEAARALRDALEELKKDPQFDLTVDPDLEDNLREIAGFGDVRLADMTGDQARTVWDAVQAVERSITLSNRLLGDTKYARVSDMADAMWDAVGDRKDRRNFAVRPLAAMDKLVNLDMMTPETFFHRLGKPGDEIHRQMRAAQDRQITITNEGVEQFKTALKESGLTAKDLQRAERENRTFTTAGGQEITLTTSQLMDLYALSHRKQAMDHIYTGGLRAQGGKAGLYETGKAAPVHVTLMDVANMLHELTPAQKGFVDRLQKYMSTTLAGYGNEATMEVYGYEKFKEQNYWPIKVNRNETKTDAAQEARAKTIPGFGMTKALTPNANNSVMLRSAVDTYAEHLNQMATYAGWLAASENITKLHNFTFFEDGQRTGTIKELFDRVFGTKGNAYLNDLLSDVAQGTKTGAESTFSDSLLNKFKAAKVGANLRVIFQQPTAILRAAEVINPVYMATIKNPLKGFERAKKWSPIALWKDWGYFEMDTGRSLRELMVGTEGAVDKVKNAAMAGAGIADNLAWGHLWNAVEAETRAEHKDLKDGSDAFYRQCAKRFGEIIDRTQVVDSVLHRTQIMRSTNFANRLATSFMSEPSKIYNMAARDFYDAIHAEKGSSERKRAMKHMVRTGAALIASFAVNAIAQSVPDAWRDDDRDKEFVRTFQDKWAENFAENFDPVGYIPYLKDIESIIQGYDVERSDMEGIADLWGAAETMMKAASGTGKKSVLNAGLEMAMKGLDLLGLPAGNIKRDVVGILNSALWATGEWEIVYEMDKLMLDVGNSNNASVFYDTLYRAMDGDWMEYQHIYGDMLEHGFSPDKINAAMNKRMAQTAGLTKAKNLPLEWAPPGEDAEFDAMIQAAGSWLDQADEDALELARTLDGAELEGDTDSEKDRAAMRLIADQPFNEDVKEIAMEGVMSESAYTKYMAARAAGVSTYDYVDFLEDARAASIARGKSGSSFSQDDVEKALNGSRLTAAQKRAIWTAQGWKKESPWG